MSIKVDVGLPPHNLLRSGFPIYLSIYLYFLSFIVVPLPPGCVLSIVAILCLPSFIPLKILYPGNCYHYYYQCFILTLLALALLPLWNTSLIFSISFRHIGHFLLVRYICTPHGRHVVTWPHGMNTKPHGSFKHTEQNPMDSSPSHLPFSTFETTWLTFPSPSDDTFMVIIYSSLLTTREKLGGSSNIILPGDVILTRLST